MSNANTESIVAEEIRIISMIRAARGVLGWSQPDLAKQAGVSLVALARLESNAASPRLSTISRLKAAIEAAGIQVIDGQPSGGFTLQVSTKALALAAEAASRKAVGRPAPEEME